MPSESSAAWTQSSGDFGSLPALLRTRSDQHPDRVCAVFDDSELTFGELESRSDRLGRGLVDRGVSEGDRVAVMLENSRHFVELFFATLRIGAVFVPINTALQESDAKYVFQDADPSVTIVHPDCIDIYRSFADDFDVTASLSVGDRADEAGFESLADLPAGGDLREATASRADLASLVYTSGSTGMPKGVRLPHGAYLTVAADLSERTIQPGDGDVLYISQPLYHIFAQIVTVEALYAGVSVVLRRKFSISSFWDRVREAEATIVHLAPSLASVVLEETTAERNPVRIAYGVGPDIHEDFAEAFDCTPVPLYGLTETCGLALTGTADEPCPGSVGTSPDHLQVRIVNEDDGPLPPNEEGEIVLRPTRPHAIFQGYHNKADVTVETVRNLWFHTGDIGYRDEEGRYHFVSRKSHFARVMGENVSMHEIERTVDDCAPVSEAVAVPVDAGSKGEEILLAVRLRDDSDAEPEDIVRYCADRLAHFKCPRYVRFVDSFPRTETKSNVERFELADTERAWDRKTADVDL